jgi:hypothetical protein
MLTMTSSIASCSRLTALPARAPGHPTQVCARATILLLLETHAHALASLSMLPHPNHTSQRVNPIINQDTQEARGHSKNSTSTNPFVLEYFMSKMPTRRGRRNAVSDLLPLLQRLGIAQVSSQSGGAHDSPLGASE